MAELKLIADSGGGTVALKAPATTTSNAAITLKLPVADGSANQLLKTDGSGNLGWATDSATDSSKMPLAGGTFTGDVLFDGATAGRDILFDRSENALSFEDNSKATFGSSGDLRIYHDGTHSYLTTYINQFYIQSENNIYLQNTTSGGSTEDMLIARGDGAVELYYNNVKTFETNSSGITVRGTEGAAGAVYIYADEGDDNADQWQFLANTDGTFLMRNVADGSWDTNIKLVGDGAVELYYDDSKKLETTSTGVEIQGQLAVNQSSPSTDFKLDVSGNIRVGDGNSGRHIMWSRSGLGAELIIGVDGYGNAANNEATIQSGTSRPLVFMTNTAERMRIESGGGLRFNTASAGGYSEKYTFHNPSETNGIYINQNSSNSYTGVTCRHGRGLSGYNGYMFSFKRNDGTTVGTITIGASSTGFNTSSDYRLKENQVTIANASTKVKQLKPYEFNFKDDPDYKHLGFFAHEIEEVIPTGVVTGAKDEMAPETFYEDGDTLPSGKEVGDVKTYSSSEINAQSVDYGKLTPLLTAALQEAIGKIEVLETKVAALGG